MVLRIEERGNWQGPVMAKMTRLRLSTLMRWRTLDLPVLLMFFTLLDDCLHSIPKYATVASIRAIFYFNTTVRRKKRSQKKQIMDAELKRMVPGINFFPVWRVLNSNILAYSISDETSINGHGTRRRPLSDHQGKDFNCVFYCEPFWPKHAQTHMVPLYGQEPVGACFWIILLRIEQIILTKQHLKM